MSWKEIILALEMEKENGIREALVIKKVFPAEEKLLLDLQPDVLIDLKRPASKVGEEYYNQAKRIESKIEGAKNALQATLRRIEEIQEEKVEVRPLKRIPYKRKKEWYERFRWFFSSDGFLVISGKDATQNEILMKKYLEQGDIVMHADLYGSPFTLIKDGKRAGKQTLEEAAIQTACYSKAWKEGFSPDVYWVEPHQVSKRAPSGEYLARGAFMVYGKKRYIKKVQLKLAIGLEVKDEQVRVIAGPSSAIGKKAKFIILIIPGKKNPDEIAMEVRRKFIALAWKEIKAPIEQIPIEEFQSLIPGDAEIVPF
jgi:predicted ribosome quality control (RQC) complex YloA/Tae2 family protein